eukprot:TRINITY_DN1291_c0_g1_i1.p1 TRINITY_DN1291_c0_g1~~TRINITY_DN1291_c0_g1_i1.p1  ORF type:complete len:769 (+),score=239.69 TRINITY_DN1291_c0_g1_i1:1001-3307(+)
MVLACAQSLLSLALVAHHAVAHGPIHAHKAHNEAENARRSRLHRQLGPQELLQLRDPNPNENKVKHLRAVKATSSEWEARLRQSPSLMSSPIRKDTDSVYADTTVSREFETDPLLDLPILLTTQHDSQYLNAQNVECKSKEPSPKEVGKGRGRTKWLEVTDDEAPAGSPSKRWQRIRNEVRMPQKSDSNNNSQEVLSAANTDHDSGWFDEEEEEEGKHKSNRFSAAAKRVIVKRRRRRQSRGPLTASDSDEPESNWSTRKSSTPSGQPSPLNTTGKSSGKPKGRGKDGKPLLSPEDTNLRHTKMGLKTSPSSQGHLGLGHTPPSRSGSAMQGLSPALQRRGSAKPWDRQMERKIRNDEDDLQTHAELDDDMLFWFSFHCLMNEPVFITLLLMVITGVLGLVVSPFFLTFHLFSIVSNSTVLQSVIRSVTKNGRSLLLTGLLAVIVIYVFSVIGFLFFQEDFHRYADTCTSMLQCFVHILFNGIREGGGIGDLMQSSAENHGMGLLYGFRASFDFTFFVIVIVILLNIIFGIIIDTFAELRSEKQKIDEDIKTKCFICGIEASEFERHANGFVHHIKRDHNMWLYIYFIHHLRTKEESEFTGQESNVYDKMKVHDLSFFPTNRAICLSNKVSNIADLESRPTNVVGSKIGNRQLDHLTEKVIDVKTETKTHNKKIEILDRRIRELGMILQGEISALRQVTTQLQQQHQQQLENESPAQSPQTLVAPQARSRGTRIASMHENVDTVPAPLHQRRSRSTTVFKNFARSSHI